MALTGVVGAGKTTTLRRLHETLTKENRVILSRSIAVEKARVTIGTLITALYCDLTTESDNGERAEDPEGERTAGP